MINIPKGTKDALPSDIYKWHYIENAARRAAEKFGFKEIRTPVFEHTELFSRGVGETTDVVTKEMYTFTDKGGRSITLRPEGTAGVARAFIENGLQSGVLPFKSYYFVSAFRYERPQAGRLREFHQFGVELYGSAEPYADAEVIKLADTFLKSLGLADYTLHLNSIGCQTCRAAYAEALKEYYRPHLSELCADCRVRFEKNPLRLLDCKEEGCKKFSSGAPRILDYLCDGCREHFDGVKRLLSGSLVSYQEDPDVVRGLDYYSRTVFEFVSGGAGAQGTLLGGGRYDALLEQLGGKPTPAVGFGAGIERLLMALDAKNVGIPSPSGVECYVLGMSTMSRKMGFFLANVLRGMGISCETDLMDRSVKAQFKYADKLGAKFVVVMGDEELAAGEAQVKDMAASSSERVKLGEVANYIMERR